jgi:hypothetical protein
MTDFETKLVHFQHLITLELHVLRASELSAYYGR